MEVLILKSKISDTIKKELLKIVTDDPYGLSVTSLYNNIRYSSGTYENLAMIFNVPVSLVSAIKEG